MSGAWSGLFVTGHHLRLTTNDHQNTPVAEDKDGQYDDFKGQEIPDPVCHLSCIAFPEHFGIADAIYYVGCWKGHSCTTADSKNPGECACQVYNPFPQPFFLPGRMDNLQITFNGDGRKVDYWTIRWTPNEVFTENHYAEPIAARTNEMDVAEFDCEYYDQKEARDTIKCILIEYQHLLLVLSWSHHRIEDKRVGGRSCDSDDYHSALEIETDTTWRPWRRRTTSGCCLLNGFNTGRCH